MGQVYRGRDTRLDRSVAIKVLPADFVDNTQLRLRFEREAKTISSLNHPHICQLYDVGQTDGIDYLVMEYLEGQSLAERLAKGPLPLSQALSIGVEIASALDKAHRQGIVHRDLKPANVMLTKSGAKLLDFGLAKTQRPGGPIVGLTHMPTEQRKLTQEGTILGTFQYMSPEQLEGVEADPRADVWALGAVLYEMVTGRQAFQGNSKTSLIAVIVSQDPAPVSQIRPLTPPALDHLISKCLVKQPDGRWQSAHDIAEELKWIGDAGSQAGVAVPAALRFRRQALAWTAAGLAVLVALAVGSRLPRRSQPGQAYAASIVPPAGTSFDFSGANAGSLTISPDGKYITFVAPASDGISRLWRRNLVTGEDRVLKGTDWAQYPFWSPDSRQIGFFADRKLKTIPIDGSTITVCNSNDARGGSWNRGGIILFEPHWRQPIYKVSASGGTPVAITKLDQSRSETTHRWPHFLPDGKHFLYLAGSHTSEATSGNNAIYVASVEGGEPRLLLRARSQAIYAAGHLVFLREQKLLAQRFDPESRLLKGEPFTLAHDVRYETGFFQAVFAASDTALVYQVGGSESKTNLNWINRRGEKLGTLGEPAVFFAMAISPDQKTVAIEMGDPGDIWLHDIQRGIRSRFTFRSLSGYPVWSPDGKSILFWSDRSDVGLFNVYRKDFGSGQEKRLTTEANFSETPLDWSRDGRHWIISRVDTRKTNKSDLWIVPAEAPEKKFPYMATGFEESDARFSPDGKLVAYVSDESGRNEVYVAPFPNPTERWQISDGGGMGPRWRRDGRELFYLANNGKMIVVPIESLWPFTAGTPTALFPTRAMRGSLPGSVPFFDVTADGQRFLINERSPEEETTPVTLLINWAASPQK